MRTNPYKKFLQPIPVDRLKIHQKLFPLSALFSAIFVLVSIFYPIQKVPAANPTVGKNGPAPSKTAPGGPVQMIKPDEQIANAGARLLDLLSAPNLPAEARASRTFIVDIQRNMYWYSAFTDSLFPGYPVFLDAAIAGVQNKDWPALLRLCRGMFKRLNAYSRTIKQDTLFLFHPLPPAAPDHAAILQRHIGRPAAESTQNSAPRPLTLCRAGMLAGLEHRRPDIFESLRQAAQDNRIFFAGATWAQPNPGDGELFVRNVLLGKNYFAQKFSVAPATFFLTGRGMLPFTLPQILRKSGYHFVMLGAPAKGCADQNSAPLFWWSSPGGAVLTCVPAGFTAGATPVFETAKIRAFRHAGMWHIPVFCHGQAGNADNGVAPLPVLPVPASIAPDDFMRRVECAYDPIPTVRDFTADGKPPGSSRVLGDGLFSVVQTAERMAVFADIPYPRNELENAWKMLLEGTTANDFFRADSGRTRAQKIQFLCRDIIDRAGQKIAAGIRTRQNRKQLTVFNISGRPRTDVVCVELDSTEAFSGIFDSRNNPVPFQRQKNSILLLARDVPPCGYKTCRLVKKSSAGTNTLTATATCLENAFFSVDLNHGNGNIQRIFDKKNNRQVMGEGNVLQYKSPVDHTTLRCRRIREISVLEEGPVRAVVRYVRILGDMTVTQDYTIYAQMPRLDVVTDLDGRTGTPHIQALFDFSAGTGSVVHDVPFGTAHRDAGGVFRTFGRLIAIPDPPGVAVYSYFKTTFHVSENGLTMALPAGHGHAEDKTHPACFRYSIYCPHQQKLPPVDASLPLTACLTKGGKGRAKPDFSFLQLQPENVVLSAVKKAEKSPGTVLRIYETAGRAVTAEITVNKPFTHACQVDLLENDRQQVKKNGQKIVLDLHPREIVTLLLE